MTEQSADVIVVGAGNAAFCAALAAQEQGAKVLMLEAAPEEESGGNSRFTAGSIRVVYNGVDDIKTLFPIFRRRKLKAQILAPIPPSSSSMTWDVSRSIARIQTWSSFLSHAASKH